MSASYIHIMAVAQLAVLLAVLLPAVLPAVLPVGCDIGRSMMEVALSLPRSGFAIDIYLVLNQQEFPSWDRHLFVVLGTST